MSLGFQATALVASPSCGNAIAWSDENLLAVASGHLVSILNPAKLFGARGLITIPASKPFHLGLIGKKDLLSGCLLPTCVSRDIRPCVRSISWSPIGFAPNASCLLAICTNEGRVKVYRMPFREFRVEWVEVMDISEMLYDYLEKANFEVSSISSNVPDTTEADNDPDDDVPISQFMKANKKRKLKALTVVEKDSNHVPASEAKRSKAASRNSGPPLITAEEYASRNAMLSLLTVAWSPYLQSACGARIPSTDGCTVLAVGGKSGRLSFWRFRKPQCYSTQSGTDSNSASLLGFLQAHDTWVTAITWTLQVSDASNPRVLLCTGSSDGSVKIWRACNRELQDSSDISHDSFSLLKEVTVIDYAPVSVLSVIVPLDSPRKTCLAIGKGSGSIDVWVCETPNSTFEKAGSYHGHNHIVTGLAWAFDGRCLYSCSQDNSLCSWIFMENSLRQVPFPSNTPVVKNPADVPNAFDSCFGLAVSPGNLVLAVVHGYDVEQLNPMYEARACKAAVAFLWIGGQHLDTFPDLLPDCNVESFPGFSEQEMISWENNIIWSLRQCEHLEKAVVVWDVIAALSAFNQSVPKYVERVLLKWLASIFRSQSGISTILSEASRHLPRIASRVLQLLNIITNQVALKKPEADKTISEQCDLRSSNEAEEEQMTLWMQLQSNIEKELRERLVGLSLSVILSLVSNSNENNGHEEFGCWTPIGSAQMEKWVNLNRADVNEHLKLLAEKVGKTKKRKLRSICEYKTEEECNFCSALVPLDSPENAFCRGEKTDAGTGPSHKLLRCAVSMRVCLPTPSWHCVCCKRSASQLVPSALFALPEYPSDFESFVGRCAHEKPVKPLCPFCGILVQRLQPEFLLSPSPV
ncbi:PREDICTED: uncharacterized protein LOC109177286 [Ipomoea nil]|uniref:uncharacterized protein LOC109177286 n=1 Tax=Ipomoea nil TaxID=35883 RepID=UPI00090118C9|nr:PREDICTED: uncharacterized protein LOC109177286 [Ipomoea nil]XP_019182146.1 PREDICTED: uncharacterized protein LOC109177286 [Ipomoea nil]